MLKKHKHISAEELYCAYHDLNIEEQEFKFINFKKGYSKDRFKDKTKSIKNAGDIIKYEHLLVDIMGRVNGHLLTHLKLTNEKIYNILKGGVKICPGCGKKCTFANFKKGYKNNCGNNSCVAVYNNIVEKGKISKIGKYKPEWNHWYNKTEEEKKATLKIRAKKTRETREKNGTYMKLEDKKPYDIYFNASSFKHGFKTNNLNEIELLKNHGVYHRLNNPKGCVRDHMLSRRYGFDNNISTWIISHPANCEIVLHSENVRRVNENNDNQITLEELLNRIENWNNN